MYKIKQQPDDFKVKEESNVELQEKGDYIYFLLKKEQYNTPKAVETLAKKLNINKKNIGFAGNKDKYALTQQTCSVKNISEDRLNNVELKDISIEVLGRGTEPISLGDLKGNHFNITIRNTTHKPKKMNRFINYFGEQRFGHNNVEVGRAIIKKDFKKAASLLDFPTDNPLSHLNQLDKKHLRLYVHAYQSKIWNESVDEVIKNNIDVKKIPIIGFGTEFENLEVKKIIKKILREEGIKPRDFIIKQLPEISCEGEERNIYCEVKGLEISELEEDELNPGKQKFNVGFFLPKGCYATVFIDQLMKDK